MDRAMVLDLELPTDVAVALQSAGLTRADLRAHAVRDLAAQLYSEGRLSLGKAARLARLDLARFWALLIERGIAVVDYTADDLTEDLTSLDAVNRDLDQA
jgi:predicted HTH domain antitoxin